MKNVLVEFSCFIFIASLLSLEKAPKIKKPKVKSPFAPKFFLLFHQDSYFLLAQERIRLLTEGPKGTFAKIYESTAIYTISSLLLPPCNCAYVKRHP